MATGIRQRLTSRLVPILAALAALTATTRAEAQSGTITGRITDQTTGTPLEASRIVLTGTTRIETSDRDGRYTFRGVAPGSYQLRVLRVGYRPEVQSATVAAGETATPRLRDDARAGAARRDRHHGHRRAAQARDRQRGLDHRRPGGRQAVADHRVHQPDLGPRAGRPGAQERRHDRHRHPHPDPRLQQRLALQRAALLHRRRAGRELAVLEHAGYRRVRGDRPGQPGAVTHQRPQSGRHRQHRDREGAGGGHALRHSGVERRRADHDQARQPRSRRGGTCSASWAGSPTTTPTRSTTTDATPTIRTSTASAFCSSSWTATAPRPRWTCTRRSRTRPPVRSRPGFASSTGSTCRAAATSVPTTSRRATRARTGCSGCPSSRRIRSATCSARCPRPRSAPTRWSGSRSAPTSPATWRRTRT